MRGSCPQKGGSNDITRDPPEQIPFSAIAQIRH
jgi:hypothetical protein